MKTTLFFLLIVALFTGCGPAAKIYHYKGPTYSTYKNGKYVGGEVYYYTPEDLINIAKKKNLMSHSNAFFAQKVIKRMDLLKKVNGKYTFNSLEKLNYNSPKSHFFSFRYNKKRGEYVLSGISYCELLHINHGKREETKLPIAFVIIFNDKTKKPKGFYYTTKCDIYFEGEVLSENADIALFSLNNKYKILNLNTAKVFSASIKPFILNGKIKYSGKYAAMGLFNSRKNYRTDGIIIIDVLNGKTIKIFKFPEISEKIVNEKYYPPRFPQFAFSHNGRYFIYKNFQQKFKVFDLVQKKEVASFGQIELPGKNWSEIHVTKNYILGWQKGKKKGKDAIVKLYVFDTDKKEILCETDTWIGDGKPFVYKNSLNLIFIWYDTVKQKIYSLDKNNCFLIKRVYLNMNRYKTEKEFNKSLLFTKDNNICSFDKGVIATRAKPKKYEISQEELEALKKLIRIKKLKKAGFKKRALKMLRQLIVDGKYDLYFNNFEFLINNRFDNAQTYALAYQRYIKEGKSIDYSWLDGAIKNYIMEESANGLKKHIKMMIDVYKKLIGSNPTQYQKHRLTIYEAIYLLEIGKDEEAYDKLFDLAPLEKKNKTFIKRYSFMGKHCALYKNIKKLSVITDIPLKELGDGKYTANKEIRGV